MSRRRAILVVTALAAVAVGGAGCQVGWVLLERMFPKRRVPAEFKLPKKATVLVFPDDVENPLSYPPVKRILAQRVAQGLLEKKLVAAVVPHDRLTALRAAEPDFNRLAVATVGRKLGADVVVYLAVDAFSLKDNPVNTLWRGKFAVRVRVVDVQKGRLWPDQTAGHRVAVSLPLAESTSETFGAELARMLAERLGEKVVGLFHEHYVERNELPQRGSIFDE